MKDAVFPIIDKLSDSLVICKMQLISNDGAGTNSALVVPAETRTPRNMTHW